MDDEKRNQITSTQLINFNELEKNCSRIYSAAHSATLDFHYFFVFLYKHTFLLHKTIFLSFTILKKKKNIE